MRKTLINEQQSPNTVVRVQFWLLENKDAGLDLSVIRSDGHQQNLTFYSPQDVTDWFGSYAKNLLATWQAAYHQSGIDPSVFHRPDLTVGGTFTVGTEKELWEVAQHALGDPKRWTDIWALNPDTHQISLAPGQVIKLPGPAFGGKATGCAQGDILLKVPYLSQRDNRYHPGGTCNVTSYAMALSFLGVKPRNPGMQLEDEFSTFMEAHGKDRHTHTDLCWLAGQYGITARFATNRTWDQIRQQIRSGRPVVVSGKYTQSGHIITIIGLHGDGFIVHDPWGNALKGYTDRNGRQLFYPYDYMHAKTRACGANGKWAHFFGV